ARRRRRPRRDLLHRDVPAARRAVRRHRRRPLHRPPRAARRRLADRRARGGDRVGVRRRGRRLPLQLRDERRRLLGPLGPLLPAAARGDRRVSKLFAFVARPPGVAAHEFWARWERRLAAIEAERRVVNEAIAGASVPGLASSPFDGAIELWGAGDRAELDAAVAELSAPGAIVLRAQESVQFDRGFGAVKFIGLSRRSERFASREEW